jgi:hypothetical protein
MRKFILISIAALACAASAAATGVASPAAKSPLVIAMHDPGCHWFYVGGGPNNRKYAKSVTRRGPVTLLNLDEAALIVKGPGGTRMERVGVKLTLTAKGTYHITMVKQAPDDNHLVLRITLVHAHSVSMERARLERALFSGTGRLADQTAPYRRA